MFSDQAVKEIVKRARAESIDPAALLAVAEVESAGRLTEDDGSTPRFLFERHVFYRNLKKLNNAALGQAVSAGLATQKWDRSVAYKDQGTSKGRLAVLAKARAIDEECANAACSWGLGQVLGENAKSLGYANATAMVSELTQGGVVAQVDSMLRFIKRNKLQPFLNLKDFAGFALKYNGPGYKQNCYDVRMAAAEKNWAKKLDAMAMEPGPEESQAPEQERVDELPPPYAEPKTPAKSKTIWTSILGFITSTFAALWTWWTALPFQEKALIIGSFVAIFLFLGFIVRERLKKIAEDYI